MPLAADSPLARRFQDQVAVSAIRRLGAATKRVAARLTSTRDPPGRDAAGRASLDGARAMLQEWSISESELDRVTFVTARDQSGTRARGEPRATGDASRVATPLWRWAGRNA